MLTVKWSTERRGDNDSYNDDNYDDDNYDDDNYDEDNADNICSGVVAASADQSCGDLS